ncbi:hypothetical protein GRC12_32455 [Streptomyces griseorubiginosus]|nr:hypothetical protein [Streptomyces griseorubiginosus]
MGRRTAWWRARPGHGRTPVRARVAAAGAVLCVSVALTAGPASAADSSYAFAADARTVKGATGTTDATLLDPGRSYRSSLPKGAKLYYRLETDASTSAYVAVTAVPRGNGKLSVNDGIKVSVQNSQGNSCSYESANFGITGSPHPITAWGARTTSPRMPLCEGGGPYYVVVERADADGSTSGTWDLELATATEPRLGRTGATSAPTTWNSATPSPLTGEATTRQGGAGFARATSVQQGVWRAGISPGQTLFYKVPVDWGQQPSAVAELGSHDGGDSSGYAVGALQMTLYNPVRADVEDIEIGYDGSQNTASLAPVPPVAYANRYAPTDQVNGMRFAGWYYLAIHLSTAVADDFGAGPFGLTLRVRVTGAAQDGPGYAGQSVPQNVFGVTAQDRAAAGEGGSGGGGDAMRALAAGGIGAGTVVLVVLGVWTVVGRRRLRAS